MNFDLDGNVLALLRGIAYQDCTSMKVIAERELMAYIERWIEANGQPPRLPKRAGSRHKFGGVADCKRYIRMALRHGPKTVGEICRGTALHVPKVETCLVGLEHEGIVEKLTGGRWRLVEP